MNQEEIQAIVSDVWQRHKKEQKVAKAVAEQKKPGFIDNKRLTINYAILNGQVNLMVLNPRTGRQNMTPIAWYQGSGKKPYNMWLKPETEHGTFCDCPVGKFNREGNRDCKHQRMLREHINPHQLIKHFGVE